MAVIDTKEDIKDGFETAKTHFKPYFDPLTEFERLARNKPHEQVVAAKLPTVTDGTLAAVVQAQPRRIIQQLPTGRVVDVVHPELAQLADYIWTNQILPRADTSGDALQKCWIASTKAKTYGSQPSYQFFKRDGEYYGADFTLPYIKDVFPEPGKLNANDSEHMFMQSWWTKAQVKARIENEKKLKKRSRDRGEQYESTWNLTALADLLNHLDLKDQASKSPTEQEKDSSTGYALIVHAFQVGVGATFYSYSPALDKILRTWKNPDPRGCLPISYLYDTIDLSNPLGRGAIELSGGMQNLLDSEVQSYQFMQKLMLNPPLKKWGSSIANSTVKWKPNAVWDMGTDPNSKLDPVEMSTDALRNFPTNYGLMKSQILNLTNNQDTSVSAESGNPSFSKTQAGVNAQEQRIAIDDNYFRKQFESWFERVAETMLNIHFAESSGTREIELTEDFLKKVPPGTTSDFFMIPEGGNQAIVLYDEIKQKLKFEVDASTTQVEDDDEQKDRLVSLLELAISNPLLSQLIKIPQLVERIVVKSGVEDPEELLPTDEELQAIEAAQMQAQMAPPAPPGAPMPPEMPPEGAEAPPMAPPPISPEDQQVVDGILAAGFSEDDAQRALVMLQNGYAEDEILAVLTQAQGAPV